MSFVRAAARVTVFIYKNYYRIFVKFYDSLLNNCLLIFFFLFLTYLLFDLNFTF